MKKFLGALFVVMMILSANARAAKPILLAELDAETFFANLGYEVDCSYWERTRDAKQLFSVILPEDPLMTVKDEPNMEVYSEMRKGNVVEVVVYLKKDADKNSSATMLAKMLNALDEKFFQASRETITRSLDEFLTASEDKIIAERYSLSMEDFNDKNLVVHIKPAQI